MRCEKVFQAIESLEKEYTTFWIDICNIESPTQDKAGVDAVGRYIAVRARARGWEVEVCPQTVSGNCVCITMNPEATGAPVVFSGHMDTVHPVGLFGDPPVHCADGKIYGPGVTDCKGGIAAAFLAMHALENAGFTERPIRLLLQSDEENSSITSDKATVRYMAEKARGCAAFLNCEPHGPGVLTVARRGILRYRFEITGKASHGASCYAGVSAIREAACKIIELEKWKDKNGVTCNCGIISGGSAENTVPQSCTFTADIRYKTGAEMEQVKRKVQEIAETSFVEGSKCVLILSSERPAMERIDRNLALFERISQIFEENGLENVSMVLGHGGSDAADMTACGIPCLDSFGVRGEFIHSEREFAYLESLAESAKMQAAIAWCI